MLTHCRGLIVDMNGDCTCIDSAHLNLLVSSCGRPWSADCEGLLPTQVVKFRVDCLDIIRAPAQAIEILVDILHDLFNVASYSVCREGAPNSYLAVQLRLMLDGI